MAQVTITADGDTEFKVTSGKGYLWRAAGTFGGGTVTLRWSDGTNDVDIQSLTADGAYEFITPAGLIKVNVNGATTPSIITDIVPISIRGGR